MPNQKEKVMNPLTLMPVKIQRMESLTTSSKPSLLSGERPRVGILLLVKGARENVPRLSFKGTGSSKKPRTEPEKKSAKAGKGKGKKKAKANSTHSRSHKRWGK